MCNGLTVAQRQAGWRDDTSSLESTEMRIVLASGQSQLPGTGVLRLIVLGSYLRLHIDREEFLTMADGWVLEDAPCWFAERRYRVSVYYRGEEIAVTLVNRT